MNKNYTYKPVEELTFSDDYMFSVIMRNEKACKGIIERLLNIKIDHIDYAQTQKTFNPLYAKKGIRLDVYVEGSDKVFDVEIQSYDDKAIGKRARYYQSMLDSDNLDKGEAYSELKESYILFICLKDPFKAELPVYTFKKICEENNSVNLQDETHLVVFNCEAFEKVADEELQTFLKFVKTNRAESEFTREIAKMVEEKKAEEVFATEYRAYNIHDMDMRNRGRAEGIEEGKRETAVNLIKFNIPISTIAQSTGLSEDYIKTLM